MLIKNNSHDVFSISLTKSLKNKDISLQYLKCSKKKASHIL